jgi:hypothetical protein
VTILTHPGGLVSASRGQLPYEIGILLISAPAEHIHRSILTWV